MPQEVYDDLPDAQAIDAFAARLEAYAESLSAHERALLDVMLMRAMDPVERRRWRSTAGLLSPREEAVLRALEHQHREG